MFDQVDQDWGSKFSLRGAILNAIAFGFVAGLDFGVAIIKVFLVHVDLLEAATYLFLLISSLALATRFYFVAMSKARLPSSPTQD